MKNKTTLDEIQKFTSSIEGTKAIIKHHFINLLTEGPKSDGKVIFIEGEAGIGKTQIIGQVLKEVAQEIKNGLHSEMFNKTDYEYMMNSQLEEGVLHLLNLAAKDPQDFTGLPIVDQRSNSMSFASPDHIPKHGVGMIFYDEANRVHDLSMKATLLSMWMDRGVNGHTLGDSYLQIAAGNPFKSENGEYETEDFDKALRQRIIVIEMIPTVGESIAYLEEKYKQHFLLDFFKENQDLSNLVSKSSGFSSRDIDKAMAITKKMGNETVLSPLTKELLKMYFDNSTAIRIENFLNDNTEVTLEKLLENAKVGKRIKKSDLPTLTRIAAEVSVFISEKIAKNKDLKKNEVEALDVFFEKASTDAIDVLFEKFADDVIDACSNRLEKIQESGYEDVPTYVMEVMTRICPVMRERFKFYKDSMTQAKKQKSKEK